MENTSNIPLPPFDLGAKFSNFTRVVGSKVPIAQTPKELVWTLNKAKRTAIYHPYPTETTPSRT